MKGEVRMICKFAAGHVPSPLNCGCDECCPALARAEQMRKSHALIGNRETEIEQLRAALKDGWSTLALINVKNYHPTLLTLQAQLLAGLEQKSDEATKEEA
jgi:hypothetical protein